MEHYLLNQDNLAVITDLKEFSMNQIITQSVTGSIPKIDDDDGFLGDIAVFKMVTDDEINDSWSIGRLCTVDPMVEQFKVENLNHIYYHRFPSTTYTYITHIGSLSNLNSLLDKEKISKDIIYPPVLTFPNGLPTSLDEEIAIDIWIAVTDDKEDSEKVDIAKVHRSYSYNYVNALLDFTNLPDYNEDE